MSSKPSNAPGTRRPAQRGENCGRRMVAGEVRCDHVGPRAQVKKALEPRQHLRQGRYQRGGDLDGECVASGDWLNAQPAAVLSDLGGAQVGLVNDSLDTGGRPAVQEARTVSARQAAADRRGSSARGRPWMAWPAGAGWLV